MNNSKASIPEFAVLGHPNEGKSSVVSTLSEDDSVRVSPTPGETVKCRTFPVRVDGKEIVRFTDTPGFQFPKKALAWFRDHGDADGDTVSAFITANRDDEKFRDECELLTPVARGAGIIYVVDGSRPVRANDRAEMEILRMTGCPRMAIINSKDQGVDYTESWKNEFRRTFNSFRVFNAHNATYAERIELFDCLKGIDQDWQPALEKVTNAYRNDWARRNRLTAELITVFIQKAVGHSVSETREKKSQEQAAREKLLEAYKRDIADMEKNIHGKIRKLFKHNIFNVDLPPQSILHKDLFDATTWQVLGLTPRQLAAAAAACGGAVGACIDVAAAGLTFGIFTAIGGVAGAGSALLGGEKMVKAKVVGLKIGGYSTRVGPNENIQFLYILLDRALLYYSHIINWAHGRRDYREPPVTLPAEAGISGRLDKKAKGICNAFFSKTHGGSESELESVRREMTELVRELLDRISLGK